MAGFGVQIEGDRLGLGTNLFSHIPTLTERFGNEMISAELSKKSRLMEELTADIVDESLKLKEGAGSAAVTATPYDNTTGQFEVTISDIKTDMDYQAVRCLAFPEEDEDNQQWYDVYSLGDGSYMAEIYAWDYGYQTGNYKVQVYLFDANGKSVMISEIGGIMVQ